ncbi:hypothetical protein [Bacteroides sp.]|uniref:hypothetical protein n=1 Tax=Bacteroides sp. TaxID=29523 RepID=UPI0026192A15|nr:hypothetical protein [Bacteroides sp.]MDD3039695.1 hypothetical protein [Bacteroides sp.]
MIIKDRESKDFVIIGPGVDYCSLHEHNPSKYTKMRITTLCYTELRRATVVISTFSEGKWDTSEYVTDEVYKENYNRIVSFLGKKTTETVY